MEIDFLVGMFAVVVAGDIAGNYDHGDAIQGGVGYAGRSVGHTGTQMAQDHGGLAGHPGVAVCRMGSDLLMADIDELRYLFKTRWIFFVCG